MMFAAILLAPALAQLFVAPAAPAATELALLAPMAQFSQFSAPALPLDALPLSAPLQEEPAAVLAPATVVLLFAVVLAAVFRPVVTRSHAGRNPLEASVFSRRASPISMMAGEPEPAVSRDQLVDSVAKKAGVSKKTAAEVLSATLDVIVDSVSEGNKVSLLGFGTFRPRDKPAREARNPRSGEKMMIEAKTVPVFSFGSKFKEAVKNANKQ
jgi:DNA-binding protein HU-beta